MAATANAVVTMDEFGRILIPKFLRGLLNANKFVARVENKRLELEPVDWASQAGSVPQINMKKFAKQHGSDWE